MTQLFFSGHRTRRLRYLALLFGFFGSHWLFPLASLLSARLVSLCGWLSGCTHDRHRQTEQVGELARNRSTTQVIPACQPESPVDRRRLRWPAWPPMPPACCPGALGRKWSCRSCQRSRSLLHCLYRSYGSARSLCLASCCSLALFSLFAAVGSAENSPFAPQRVAVLWWGAFPPATQPIELSQATPGQRQPCVKRNK